LLGGSYFKFSVGIVFVLNRSGTIQNIMMYNKGLVFKCRSFPIFIFKVV